MIRFEVGLPTAVLPVIRDRKWQMITIGIDRTRSSLTAVAVHASGEVAAVVRLEVNGETVSVLQAWGIAGPSAGGQWRARLDSAGVRLRVWRLAAN